MKSHSLLIQTALMLSALAAYSQGTMIYDQQSATNQGPAGGDAGAPIGWQQPMGQSFTPALSAIGFVQFKFADPSRGDGVGATVYVNVLADSISGTVLASTTPVLMPDGFFWGTTSFFFSAPVSVTPDTTYYLQPVVLSGDPLWDVIGGNYGYPGVTFYSSGAPSSSGLDLWFREGVIIPEPQSGPLVLLGIAGICAVRRVRRFRARYLATILVGLLASAGAASAQLQTGERVWSPPRIGSFHSMQRSAYPPLPCLPFDVPVYRVVGRTNSYVYDDRSINYDEIEEAQRAAQAQASLGATARVGSDSPVGETPFWPDYGPTDFWLEITDIVTNNVFILAHNTQVNYFQLLSKTNLAASGNWQVEQQFPIESAGDLGLDPVPEQGRSQLFFWAAQSDTVVSVTRVNDAIRPGPCYPGSNGYFLIQRYCEGSSSHPELPVRYRISGTATNGVDYTSLDGLANLPEGFDQLLLEVAPIASLFGSNLTVTVTLVMTNDYLVNSNGPTATIVIEPNVFSLVATNISNPIGLDYHTLTDSLLVSVDPSYCASNFVRIDASGNVSHWANVTDLPYPTPLATVKTTANGFTNGATYFDGFYPSTGSIGWLSPAGDAAITNWALLQDTWSLGGLYVDQSGSWGGDLIATSGGDSSFEDGGGVWRVTSSGVATQVVNLYTCLGGVITLTNDPTQWGLWAGKIITGQNYEESPEFPEIYAIDTAGQVLTYTNLGIPPEQINLIPPGQSFYFCDTVHDAVWEIPSTVFTNHVGQLLMTGPGDSVHPPALYIVHYDAGVSNPFVAEKIDLPEFIGRLEQGAFAPLTNMPCLHH